MDCSLQDLSRPERRKKNRWIGTREQTGEQRHDDDRQHDMEMARKIARDSGLNYVYIGNIASKEGNSTICPGCGDEVVRRSWHHTDISMEESGICKCGHKIIGVWKF